MILCREWQQNSWFCNLPGVENHFFRALLAISEEILERKRSTAGGTGTGWKTQS